MIRCCCLMVLLWLPMPLLAEPAGRPLVLSSIKPLQLLVAAVAGERVDNQLLLEPGVSAHSYQMRPSQRRSLQQADLVFWLGPSLERFLTKPLAVREQPVIALCEVLSCESQAHEDEHAHQHDLPQELAQDPHLWLSPRYAVAMSERIAQSLARVDPAQADYYWQRQREFAQRLTVLDQSLRERLALLGSMHYVVMHDAYGHFEASYGLRRYDALSLTPEQKPGARHMAQLRQRIRAGAVSCIFAEPQYSRALTASLVEGMAVLVLQLDPLAGDIAVSDRGYEQFLQRFAAAFEQCREGASSG